MAVEYNIKQTDGNWRNLATGSIFVPPGLQRPFPLVASMDGDTTESTAEQYTRYTGYGYNGWVNYSPGSLAWTSGMAGVAAAHGNDPVNMQMTPKAYNEADLRDVLNNLPEAWKPGFRWNYFQEPEDNLTTAQEQLDYRDTYSAAAAVIREYPGIPLPWVEWAEYTTLLNSQGDFSRDLANFTPPAADFGGVLWSFFEYGENISLTRIDDKVARVLNAMATYAPGKPFALMASCYTLEPGSGPFSSQQLTNQATWLRESFHKLRNAGCVGWAWFNHNFAGSGGSAGEGRVEENPEALTELQTIAAAGYTVGST